MTYQLPSLIDAFANLDVLVIGEAMLDSYLAGTSDRLCREAPVPIVTIRSRTDAPGGAANTAVNVRSLGGRVAFLSVVGDDQEGRLLRQALAGQNVATTNVLTHRARQTIAKHRVIASSQILVRFDQGSTEPLDPATEQTLIDRLADLYPRSDAVIVSDYGYGILTPRVVARLADLQARYPRVLVVDAKQLATYREVGVTAVKPNFEEVVRLLGGLALEHGQHRADAIAAQSQRILDLTGARLATVTLDTDGALVIERGGPLHRTYAHPVANSRAAGAGDTFVSTLALALAAGADCARAAELASAAAAVVVAKDGTAACAARELREHLSSEDKRVIDLPNLLPRLSLYRLQQRRIVFTNGCFDLLHRGHIAFLNRAKALGDVLIVGLNGDASVRRLKGPDRPINSLEDRAQVLAALSCVDHIVPFDDDTAEQLVQAIRPDVFVKGGNYTRAALPEAPLVEQSGGMVHILPHVLDRSTTGIIRRVREAQPAPVPGEQPGAVQPIH